MLMPAILILGGGLILAVRPAVVFAVPNSFVPDVPRIAYAATFFVFGMGSRLPIVVVPASAFCAAPRGGRSISVRHDVTRATASRKYRECRARSRRAGHRVAVGARAIGLVSATRIQLPRTAARLTQFAYPIYVVHLPIVCAVQVLAYPWPIARHVGDGPVIRVRRGVLRGCSSRPLCGVAPHLSALLLRARSIPAERWAAAALAFGILVRLVQYGRNPDVWHDEAALLVNVIERGYQQLLAPLTFYEAAPPLFLWIERWIALHVSDTQWVMRLLPLAPRARRSG